MRPKGRRKAIPPICRTGRHTSVTLTREDNRMDRSLPSHSTSRIEDAAPGVRVGLGRVGVGRRGRARASARNRPRAIEAGRRPDAGPRAGLLCRHRRPRQAGGREHSRQRRQPAEGRANPERQPRGARRAISSPASPMTIRSTSSSRTCRRSGATAARARRARRQAQGSGFVISADGYRRHQQPRHRRRRQDPGQLRQGQQVRGRADRHRPAHRPRAAQDQGGRRRSRS